MTNNRLRKSTKYGAFDKDTVKDSVHLKLLSLLRIENLNIFT